MLDLGSKGHEFETPGRNSTHEDRNMFRHDSKLLTGAWNKKKPPWISG